MNDSAPKTQIYIQKAENASAAGLDLFFFDTEPAYVLDSYQRIDSWDGSPVGGASRSGDKLLVVFANYARDRYAYGAMNSLESLSRIAFPLSQENPSGPLMSGTQNILAGSDCALELRPSLARIYVESLCCDFSGKAYEGETLKDASIYLTNVCSEYRPLSGESVSWINAGMFSETDAASLSHPGMLRAQLPGEIGSAVSFPDISLYCYPNCIDAESLNLRFTRLVIEGTIMGRRYYYPININREGFGYVSGEEGIAASKNYVLNIVLTRLGTDDPDKPVGFSAVSVRSVVLPWSEFPEYVVHY